MRGRVAAGLVLVLTLAMVPGFAEVELVRPEETLLALFTLETQVEVEESVLVDVEAAYRVNAEERRRYNDRLAQLYSELESSVSATGDDFDPDEIGRRDVELERLEKAQTLSWDEGRRLRRRMLDIKNRMALLQSKIDGLTEDLPEATRSMTGYWDIVFVPGEQRGVFFLNHSAAVLTGEYALEGGYHGSLQGTIIDGKVLLHRIDSRLGRVMDLDGRLTPDGMTIRGSWRRFDLSDGRASTGAWSATKRPAAGQAEGERP